MAQAFGYEFAEDLELMKKCDSMWGTQGHIMHTLA